MAQPFPSWTHLPEDERPLWVSGFVSRRGEDLTVWRTPDETYPAVLVYNRDGWRVAKAICTVMTERGLLHLCDLIVDAHPRPRGWLARLTRPRTRRGQGIGTHVMRTVIELARARGLERVVLGVKDTLGDQPALAGWYAKFGFEPWVKDHDLPMVGAPMVLDL